MIEAHRRLLVTFHADLSDAHPGEDYWLVACGRRYPLVPHDAASRARVGAEAPHLAAERFTHITAEAVVLPNDTVVRVHIKHTLRTFPDHAGEHGVHHVAIHRPPVPAAPLEATAAPGLHHHHPIDYLTTAKSLVFHHADLINKDPQTTAIIQGYMDNDKQISAAFENLAELMRELGPATENSGWARLVPFTPENPEAAQNGGNTYYFHQPVEDVVTAAGPVMTLMMKATKNDPALEVHTGQQVVGGREVPVVHGKWTQATGISVVASNGQEVMQHLADVSPAAAGGDDWQASLANHGPVHGLTTKIEVVDSARKQLKITLENTDIRYLGAFIRFYDANGKTLLVPAWKPDNDSIVAAIVEGLSDIDGFEIQYTDLRLIGYVGPVNNILAIPITKDPGTLEVTVTFPAAAVSASIYGSGLGTGANGNGWAPLLGGSLTALLNLGVPAFMLAAQVAAQSYKPLYRIVQSLMSSQNFVRAVIGGAIVYFGAAFGRSAAHKEMNWRALTTLSKLLFKPAANALLAWIESEMAEEKAAEEIPFAGWILIALDIATGAAQMAETIVEVASSPWNIENRVATSITTRVALHPDPRHQAFPQGEQPSYTVRMIYKSQNRPSVLQHHALEAGFQQDVLDSAFPDNTLGGEVRFEADFYLGQWLAGKATSGWMDNDALQVDHVDLYLVEYPVPLSDESIYRHTALLTYQDGAYAWQQTPEPPQATIASRNTADAGNAISAWHGLTLSQRHAMIGFAWKAAGMGITSCLSHQGGQLNAMMNVDIPGMPMGDAQFPSCGFAGPTQLIYDPYPPKFLMKDGQWVLQKVKRGGQTVELPVPDPADQDWGAYWVDPRKSTDSLEKDGGYHLRKFTLDPPSPFDLGDDLLSHARFAYFPSSFVLHPSGHVIAVTSHDQINKLQIAELNVQGAADGDLPVARTYAGEAQQKERRGLLFFPVAVTASYDGTIFVLEDTKSSGGQEPEIVARIQAFDLHGNPVNRFFDDSGNPSPFLDLGDAADKTYLDLAAIGNLHMTYLYVLFYTGDGSAPPDYSMAIYQYGAAAPASNPLVTTPDIPADRLAVDMWHTVYTLDFDMVTDGHGHHAGPKNASTGPAGRTVPALSEWLPPVPPSLPGPRAKGSRAK